MKGTLDNELQKQAQSGLLKWAAGHEMFCPACSKVLDFRTTSIVAVYGEDGGSETRTYCTPCVTNATPRFREMVERDDWPVVKVEIDTVKGTEVFE